MGVTEAKFAQLALSELLNLKNFINLDGGSSTNMVDENLGFLNSPIQTHIQGLPRPVRIHLGFYAKK